VATICIMCIGSLPEPDLCIFFFQAEDGIRDFHVTGVQTCALPICFGGSVSALRLTEKGYRVGVLEAGRRFTRETLPRNSWDLRNFLWAPRLGCYGIQRIHLLRNVLILAGAGVGGGSLNYANTLYEPLDDFYADRQWCDITDWRAELAPFYDLARRMLGVRTNPAMTPADLHLRKIGDDLGVGHTFRLTPVGVYFGD